MGYSNEDEEFDNVLNRSTSSLGNLKPSDKETSDVFKKQFAELFERKGLIRRIEEWAAKHKAPVPPAMPKPPIGQHQMPWKKAEPGGWKGLKALESHYAWEREAPWHAFGYDLNSFFEAWEKRNKPMGDFFRWLTSPVTAPVIAKYFSFNGDRIQKFVNGVKYLDYAERRSYSCDLTGEKITWRGRPLDTILDTTNTNVVLHNPNEGNLFIWVFSPSNIFYTAPGEVRVFHHSSFLAGAHVKGAGQWRVMGGKVEYIDNRTGHYQSPEEQLVRVVLYLQDRGVFAYRAKVNPYGADESMPVDTFLNKYLYKTAVTLREQRAVRIAVLSELRDSRVREIIGTHRAPPMPKI